MKSGRIHDGMGALGSAALWPTRSRCRDSDDYVWRPTTAL